MVPTKILAFLSLMVATAVETIKIVETMDMVDEEAIIILTIIVLDHIIMKIEGQEIKIEMEARDDLHIATMTLVILIGI